MICRSVASLATIDTRPSCIVICTSADAVDAASSDRVPATTSALSFIAPSILLLPEVVDDLDQDVVEPVPGRITDEPFRLRQRRDAAGHVFESGLVGLFVGDELDDRFRTAQLAHALGQLQNRHFLDVAD